MCVCTATQAAALRLSPQENFNLPVDPCDGATANSLAQPAGVQILSSHPQHNVYIFYMLHQRLSFAFFFFCAFLPQGFPSLRDIHVTVIGKVFSCKSNAAQFITAELWFFSQRSLLILNCVTINRNVNYDVKTERESRWKLHGNS